MKKHILFVLLGIFVGSLATYAYMNYMHQSTSIPLTIHNLETGAATSTSGTTSSKTTPANEKALRADLDLEDWTDSSVTISKQSGVFYLIDVHQVPEGGGIYIIAKKLSNGHYMNIFRGQDNPPCYVKEIYDVPIKDLGFDDCSPG